MPKYYTKKVGKRIWYLNRTGSSNFMYFSLKPTKKSISSLPKGFKVVVAKSGMPHIKRI